MASKKDFMAALASARAAADFDQRDYGNDDYRDQTGLIDSNPKVFSTLDEWVKNRIMEASIATSKEEKLARSFRERGIPATVNIDSLESVPRDKSRQSEIVDFLVPILKDQSEYQRDLLAQYSTTRPSLTRDSSDYVIQKLLYQALEKIGADPKTVYYENQVRDSLKPTWMESLSGNYVSAPNNRFEYLGYKD